MATPVPPPEELGVLAGVLLQLPPPELPPHAASTSTASTATPARIIHGFMYLRVFMGRSSWSKTRFWFIARARTLPTNGAGHPRLSPTDVTGCCARRHACRKTTGAGGRAAKRHPPRTRATGPAAARRAGPIGAVLCAARPLRACRAVRV